jgi:hypothetical protein
MHQLFFPNGFEKTKVRWEKIKIKLAHNVSWLYAGGDKYHKTPNLHKI